MHEAIKILGVGALSLAAGFGAGRLSAPADEVAPATEPKPQQQPAADPPPLARSVTPASAPHCEDAHIALRFMKASRELDQAREREIRRSFDDGSALEEAMKWMSLAEAVIAQCLPESLELSFMECSEYPCVAALAGPVGASMEAQDELEFEANEALEACAPLVEVFGDDYPVGPASLLPFPVSCPDGEDEQAWVLLLLDPTGEAFDDLQAEPEDRVEAARINRWLYRRAHDVDHKWICEDETEAVADD